MGMLDEKASELASGVAELAGQLGVLPSGPIQLQTDVSVQRREVGSWTVLRRGDDLAFGLTVSDRDEHLVFPGDLPRQLSGLMSSAVAIDGANETAGGRARAETLRAVERILDAHPSHNPGELAETLVGEFEKRIARA